MKEGFEMEITTEEYIAICDVMYAVTYDDIELEDNVYEMMCSLNIKYLQRFTSFEEYMNSLPCTYIDNDKYADFNNYACYFYSDEEI